jgi:hypothetical protein
MIVNATATLQGRGGLLGPWPPAPNYASPGVVGVPGFVVDGSRAYGQVSGPCCDPAWAGPGPAGDPAVVLLNTKTGYLASLVLPGAH